MSDLKGFEQLAKKLKRLETATQKKIVRRGVTKMATVIRKEMRNKAPRKSGRLYKNLRFTTRRDPNGGFTAKVGAFNWGFHARFLEYGTKPHRIPNQTVGRGRHKRRNKAVVKIGNRIYSSVMHPGSKPKPFMQSAFMASRDKAMREAGKAMFDMMSKI